MFVLLIASMMIDDQFAAQLSHSCYSSVMSCQKPPMSPLDECVVGSIPNCLIPKTVKLVLPASVLGTQYFFKNVSL